MPRWEGKSRGGSAGYKFFIFLIRKLGIRFAYFFLVFVAGYFVLFAPKATKSVWFYSRKALKLNIIKAICMIYLNYYRFGQILIDKVAIRSGLASKYKYKFENYNEFLDVLNSNTGVIMIGAHVGNWEAGGTFFGDYASKMNVVMYDAEYQKIKQILETNSETPEYKIIPISESDLGHVYAIKEALSSNEYVCFQGDRFVAEKSVFSTKFMGLEAKFPVGPFHTAAAFKVPVVFYYAMRERGMQYKFKFTYVAVDSTKKTRETEVNLQQLYISSLENILKEYPEQWFNYYKFWN